jgi:hypothetical protein
MAGLTVGDQPWFHSGSTINQTYDWR